MNSHAALLPTQKTLPPAGLARGDRFSTARMASRVTSSLPFARCIEPSSHDNDISLQSLKAVIIYLAQNQTFRFNSESTLSPIWLLGSQL